MDLSFDEVVVLAAVAANDGILTRSDAATQAARMFPSTKYDVRVALADITGLLERDYLKVRRGGKYLQVTLDGYQALKASFAVIDDIQRAFRRIQVVP